MTKEVERLREDIEPLVTQAQQQDESDDAALGSRRGDALPAELTRREDRLARIESAMRRLEAQARAEADAERKRRAEAEVERRRAGKPRRGKEPKPVDESPAEKAQSNFTDPELHIMPTNNKGWDDCGNAQARVDETCQIIVSCDVTDASNDTQQAEPMGQATLSIRPWPPGVSAIMIQGRPCLRSPLQRKRVWPQKCRRPKGKPWTPDAR